LTIVAAGANRFLRRREELALDYAAAVNARSRMLRRRRPRAIAEPYTAARPRRQRRLSLLASRRSNRALDGVTATNEPGHICFGYAGPSHSGHGAYSFLPELDRHGRSVGVDRDRPIRFRLRGAEMKGSRARRFIWACSISRDIGRSNRPRTVHDRIRSALPHAGASGSSSADCGLKYPAARRAMGTMCAMVEGARMVRREVGV